MVVLFFSWWYGYLPRRLYSAFMAAAISLFDAFSVKTLLYTWFSPWKRDIISTDGLTIQQKFQVLMLNLASRVIGFLVKTSVLIAFSIVFLLTIIISFGLFVIWLAFPLVVAGLLIFGFFNLASTNS